MTMIEHASFGVICAATIYVVIRLVLGVIERREWDV